MKRCKKTGRPLNPAVGQLYFEPYSRTMRKWNGKLWEELNTETLNKTIKDMAPKWKDTQNESR